MLLIKLHKLLLNSVEIILVILDIVSDGYVSKDSQLPTQCTIFHNK